VFTKRALDDARARIVDALDQRGTLSVADIRDLLDSSRKYVIPIVTRMDADGVTRRRGDDRIAGPRASAAS
jgi:selenocysteine-specific elongation factor